MAKRLYHVHGFVDGAYLRRLATDSDSQLVNPRQLVANVAFSKVVQTWGTVENAGRSAALTRVIYYDARPDDESSELPELRKYWRAVEVLPDTELGFGSLKGGTKTRPPRQKAVDTLMTVDMLVGAFDRLFDIAVLVAGDADFVPVVNEVRRRGGMVVVAGEARMADDLRRAADRYLEIGPGLEASLFPPMTY